MFDELPIHPMFVHFPIALFMTAWGVETASLIFRRDKWHEFARQIFIIAVVSCALTVLSGLWEQWRLHLNHPVLTRHRVFGLTTLAISFTGLIIDQVLVEKKSNQARIIFFLFLCLIATSIGITSFFGGEMVYEYGVGVAK